MSQWQWAVQATCIMVMLEFIIFYTIVLSWRLVLLALAVGNDSIEGILTVQAVSFAAGLS